MRILITSLLVLFSTVLNAQSDKVLIYNPEANAQKELNEVVSKAKANNKHVMIQIGGNWCPWCIKLHNFIEENHDIDSIIKADYIFFRINYSPENKNSEVLQMLNFLQRFGFPVIVILDENGNRIHTQDTGYIEENNSYSHEKLERLLLKWNKQSLNPENYQ